jgi:phosphoenolpyruvate carboxykinase (ATP)
VQAALSGALENVAYKEDPIFHVMVPKECPNCPSDVLWPKNTWEDKDAYDQRARKLARDFAAHFDKAYGDKGIDPVVAAACPGK